MAARNVSSQFLKVVQRSNFCSALQPFAASRRAAGVASERGAYGGSLSANQQLHSEAQAHKDDEATKEYESEKMTSEGGGSIEDADFKKKAGEVKQQGEEKLGGVTEEVEGKANDVKDAVKEKTSVAGGKAEEVADEAKSQAAKNADTAKDMFKDFPQKVSETATGLKEVGVEAAKAVKRDAEKIAQKTGLKNE